jgi:hypothetical protein
MNGLFWGTQKSIGSAKFALFLFVSYAVTENLQGVYYR